MSQKDFIKVCKNIVGDSSSTDEDVFVDLCKHFEDTYLSKTGEKYKMRDITRMLNRLETEGVITKELRQVLELRITVEKGI
jgi:hypothetical protein